MKKESQLQMFLNPLRREGFVYIFIHPLKPKVVKVGSTRRSPNKRASELTKDKTGVALNYVVAYAHKTRRYKELEKRVHRRLAPFRVDPSKEFFYQPEGVQDVIEIIKYEERLLDQPVLAQEFIAPDIWWAELDPVWKHIFKKKIGVKIIPDKLDLMEGIFNIIEYSRNDAMRNAVSELIKDKFLDKRLLGWYENLSEQLKAEVCSFTSVPIDDKKIKEIQKIEELECNNNMLITHLEPLKFLSGLKVLNCSDTEVSNLRPLEQMSKLEELHMNFTRVGSLKPISNLNLKRLYCHNIGMSEEELEKEIEKFKLSNPNCEVFTKL